MKRGIALLAAFCTLALQAHDGPHPAEPIAFTASPVQRLPDGSLVVPKSVQRLLGLRTTSWPVAATPIKLLAEVQAQPGTATSVFATEAGALQAPEGGWLLPGQTVQKGALLAWLKPQVASKDRARRGALEAELEQRLRIATLNADRLRLQAAVTEDNSAAKGNLYYAQAHTEELALAAQLVQLRSGLAGRLPIRAQSDGVLLASNARAGDVVAAGQALFRLHDANHLRLIAQSADAALGATPLAATAGDAPLHFKGAQPLVDGTGWQLLFDLQGASNLQPGQVVEIAVLPADATPVLPTGACIRAADGSATLWQHVDAERFAPLHQADCSGLAHMAAAGRIVTEGASLLAQYQRE